MNIIQEPTASGLYFHSTVPDIIIEKSDASTEITFELFKAGVSILAEKYVYDSESRITIHNLTEIFEKYFDEQMTNLPSSTSFTVPGVGPLVFSFEITEGVTTHSREFKVMRCDAEMIVEPAEWLPKNFLTRSYRQKRTSVQWIEFLSFLQLHSFGICTKHFRLIYMLDGVETEAIGTFGTIETAESDVVTSIYVSTGQILTAANLAKLTKCIRFEVWLTGTSFETNRYLFMVDNTPNRTIQPFVFVNSFGVLETFTASGHTYNANKVESSFSQIDRKFRRVHNDLKIERTCNSGYLSENEMEWIDDFICSNAIGAYNFNDLVIDEVTISEVEKNNADTNELMAFSFKYRRASNNHLQFLQAADGIFDKTFDNTFE